MRCWLFRTVRALASFQQRVTDHAQYHGQCRFHTSGVHRPVLKIQKCFHLSYRQTQKLVQTFQHDNHAQNDANVGVQTATIIQSVKDDPSNESLNTVTHWTNSASTKCMRHGLPYDDSDTGEVKDGQVSRDHPTCVHHGGTDTVKNDIEDGKHRGMPNTIKPHTLAKKAAQEDVVTEEDLESQLYNTADVDDSAVFTLEKDQLCLSDKESQNGAQNGDQDELDQDPSTKVYPYTLGHTTMIQMTQTLRKVRELGLPDQLKKNSTKGSHSINYPLRQISNKPIRHYNRLLKINFGARNSIPEYQRLLRDRLKLPIQGRSVTQRLTGLIEANNVVVLVSQTGSGKTTQLPQLILDWQTRIGKGASCNIICTQPRRLAAVSIARRVAQEQQTAVGKHVGYSVRFDKQAPRRLGSIGYWTAGVLLKDLYDEPETVMTMYSHLIIDEVHERDVTTDLVLTILRDLIRMRTKAREQCPKVILMSATIDALDFQRYFAEPSSKGCLTVGLLEVPGRNFGVQIHSLDEFLPQFEQYDDDARFMTLLQSNKDYLASEDKFTDWWESHANSQGHPLRESVEPETIPTELIAATIVHALKSSDDGDVLVFLPGIGEIERVKTSLQSHAVLGVDFNDPQQISLHKLHASLWETNDQVFEPVPDGCRRVVLSTNIAQTSITLPDVAHVIDSGQQRRMSFNPMMGANEFRCNWIDKSTAVQRQGRAGRTRPGHYWTIYTRARWESFRDKPMPEIKTIPLSSACLAIQAQTGGQEPAKNVLARCMDPPDLSSIDPAIEELKKLRALDDNGKITPLGRFAAWFPLEPATARALLLGVLFRCLEPILVMAAHSTDKPLIHHASSLRARLQSVIHFAGLKDDDRAAYVSAFQLYDSAYIHNDAGKMTGLEEVNVKPNAYKEMLNVSRQLCDLMSVYGILPTVRPIFGSIFARLPSYLSENSSSDPFVKGVALAMQYSSLGVYNEEDGRHYVKSGTALIRPFSINGREAMRWSDRTSNLRDGRLISYSSLLNLPTDKKPTMSETSSITPLMAMLFCGSLTVIDKNTVQINDWLKYRITAQSADGSLSVDNGNAVELIFEFRKTLDRFIQAACASLQRSNHSMEDSFSPAGQQISISSPFSEGNVLTETFAQGLKAILESDSSLWDEYLFASEEISSSSKRRHKR